MIISGLNLPNYSLRADLRFTNFSVQRVLNEYKICVYSMFTVMSWKNFIFIFSSGLKIFSTLLNSVCGCFIHVLFNLTKSTIVNHQLSLVFSNKSIRYVLIKSLGTAYRVKFLNCFRSVAQKLVRVCVWV